MLFRVVILCALILCLSIHGSKGRKRNATRRADNEDSTSSFTISPSYSYQYHTNDKDDDFDVNGNGGSVKHALNNSATNVDSSISSQTVDQGSIVQEDSSSGSNLQYAQPVNDGVYSLPQRDNYRAPDQINSYVIPAENFAVPVSNSYSSNTYSAPAQAGGFQHNINSVQNEGHQAPGQSYASLNEDYTLNPNYNYASPNQNQGYDYTSSPSSSYGYALESTPAPLEGYAQAQSKGFEHGFFFGGDGDNGGGPGFGNAEPAPAIKGSIDYVLIPLILIGIAGPIFVVLYVVLGSFEAKLSPIITTRKIQGWDDVILNSWKTLQPATEILLDSIDKGLHYQCTDQLICHMASFGHDLGLGNFGFLQPVFESLGLQKSNKRKFKLFFDTIKRKPKSCSSIKCTNLSSTSTLLSANLTTTTTTKATTMRRSTNLSSRYDDEIKSSKSNNKGEGIIIAN